MELAAGDRVPPFDAFVEAITALIRDFPLAERAAFLDFGCGVGQYSELLERYFPRRFDYTGCDYSQEMITVARARWPGRTFVVNDVFDNKLDLDDFDIVFASALVDVLPEYERALDILLGSASPYVVLHRQRITANASLVGIAQGYSGQKTYRTLVNLDRARRTSQTATAATSPVNFPSTTTCRPSCSRGAIGDRIRARDSCFATSACWSPAVSASSARTSRARSSRPAPTSSSSTRWSRSTAATSRTSTDIDDRVTVNISDVRDEHSFRHLIRGQDFLFNLAGQTSHLDSMRDPYTDLEINCRSQLSILEACRQHNPDVKVVFASTRQIYGRPQYLPVDEKHPIVPGRRQRDQQDGRRVVPPAVRRGVRPPRRRSAADEHLRAAHARGGRAADVPRLLAPARAVRASELTIFGDGAQRRDFNYVDDAVSRVSARRGQRRGERAGLQPRRRERGRPARARRAARRASTAAGRTGSCRSRPIARRSTSATTTPTSHEIRAAARLAAVGRPRGGRRRDRSTTTGAARGALLGRAQ